MLTPFKQFTPVELYIGIDNPKPIAPEGDESQPTEKINGFRSTGCDFLDIFLNNLYVHGLHSCTFHSKLLRIEPLALSYTVQTLTGLKYADFSAQCTLLMANDLLNRSNNGLSKVSNRLGFTSYSGFFRFLKRYTKQSPTGRKQPKPTYEMFIKLYDARKL